MSIRKKAAFALILFLAGIPLSIAAVAVSIVVFKGHETILERELQQFTGLTVDLEGLEPVSVDQYRLAGLNLGDGLFKAENVEIRCGFDPFVIKTLTVAAVHADLTGTNTVKLGQLIRTIRMHPRHEPLPFAVTVGKASVAVTLRGGPWELAFGVLTVSSADGNQIEVNLSRICGPDQQEYCVAISSRYDIATGRGEARAEGNLNMFNPLVSPRAAFRDVPFEGLFRFEPSPGSLGFGIGIVTPGDGNRSDCIGRVSLLPPRIDIDAFRTDLGHAAACLDFADRMGVGLAGGAMMGSGAIEFDLGGGITRLAAQVTIETPEITFRRDIKLGNRVLFTSRLQPFRTERMMINAAVRPVTGGRGLEGLTIETLSGYVDSGAVFWNAAGAIGWSAEEASSKLDVSLFELPLEAARALFILFDAGDGWLERLSGPVDVTVSGFDITRPEAEPLVISSGSAGIQFWVADNLPRIDGIYFNDLKLYLPPCDKAHER